MTAPTPTPRPCTRCAPLLLVSLVLAALLPGCAKPLLSPADERSPFDRYDAIRNDYAKQDVEDEFGRLHPNLRGRLAPR